MSRIDGVAMSPIDGIAEESGGALTEAAHAKINLYLHVVGRRADGYHLLDSLAVFAGAHDRLRVRRSPDPGLRFALEGRFGAALAGDDADGNLVIRAARAVSGDGLDLTLEKNLPVASGIGGGSADAAACLRLMARLGDEPAHAAGRSVAVAASLGADVPVCLAQRPARMRGIGEILDPAPRLPACFLVLVNCGVGVSTQAVFRARPPGFRPEAALPAAWPDAQAMAADLTRLSNDLEAPAIALCPPIATVLAAIGAMQGCLLARMSGSGATCFGLFATLAAAELAASRLERPDWWIWAGPLHEISSI